MKSNTPQMIIAHENPEDNTLYLNPAIPFDLLEITTSGKSLPEYYKKLDFLTRVQELNDGVEGIHTFK